MKNENLLYIIFLGLGLFMALALLISVPFTTENIKRHNLPFESKTEFSNEFELGDSLTLTTGVEGKKEETTRVIGSIFQRMFRKHEIESKVIDTKIIASPIDEVLAKGTRKYQYMHCSNGGYQYYPDEEFQNPSIGFTSKSEDFCAKNNTGVRVRIADAPPQTRRTTCVDVTSYDYNWNNDVLCTNPDGSTYYTSYAGAGW